MYFDHETDYNYKIHQPEHKSIEVEPNTERPTTLLLFITDIQVDLGSTIIHLI